MLALVLPIAIAAALALPRLALGVANPLAFSYSAPGESLMQYAHPGGMVVLETEAPNTSAELIRRFRAGGGEVLLYLNLVDGPPASMSNPTTRAQLYGAARGTNPAYLWQPVRYNFQSYPMLDIRRGSAFSNHAVDFVSQWVKAYGADGIFLDVLGSRLFSGAWSAMSPAERAAWTDGAYDLVSRIRAAVGDRTILVANNIWDGGQPALNGFCVEHHGPSEIPFFASQLAWPGWHQPVRNIVIASGPGDAAAWRYLPGVTHVAAQTNYNAFGAPLWGFTPLPLPFSAPPPPVPSATPAPLILPPAAAPLTPRTPRVLRTREPRLLSTSFATGALNGWLPLVEPRAGAVAAVRDGREKAIQLSEQPGMGGYAAIGARVAPNRRVEANATINLARLRLAPGHGRTLLAVGSGPEVSYQLGVVRTRRRGLRWAVWVNPVSGPRRAALGGRVHTRRWVHLRLRTAWSTRRARGVLRVDGRVTLRTRPANLRSAAGSLVSVGLGRPTTDRQAGILLVRSVSVSGAATPGLATVAERSRT
jgi:hypothetical protein